MKYIGEIASKVCAIAGDVEEFDGIAPKLDSAANALEQIFYDLDEAGDLSDGYHTFDELYHHRAVLFSVIVSDHKDIAWKSKLHDDGTMYDDMFIVGVNTPHGQATYHYNIDPYWDIFDCVELPNAPAWDGHTPDEAIERIGSLR